MNSKNDFDRIADEMQDAVNYLVGNMHPIWKDNTDSITIKKEGALIGIIKMQRSINWCRGHATTRHNMDKEVNNNNNPTAIVAALRELPADVLAQVVRELMNEMEIPY